jgi:hypothetical protein
MPVLRCTAKAFSVALLFLSMTVVTSAQSIAELKKQAAAGDANAQSNLGAMYANGQGVPKDEAEAVRWYPSGHISTGNYQRDRDDGGSRSGE